MKNLKLNKSHTLFKKAIKLIPLASQTFSKSYLQFIKGRSPLFAARALGAYLWDVDGNRYLDMINGLLPVVLGYQYPAVDRAITSQLKKGITFSLSCPSEYELAQLLIKHIPSAEMVRFGKNGSDVTTGAVRVARAYTGREHVAVCGYHGWHDWYIGATARNLGVPKSTRALTHKFEYNNVDSLKQIMKRHKLAAVIMEPMSYEEPRAGFLKEVARVTRKHGALLIFDEVICGFRYSLGGAQKLFGVTPDLSTFGKSMANGMPISVLAGRRKYMKVVDDIFYSFTNGGEVLSIAAAVATIREMEKKNVIGYIWKLGKKLQDGTNRLLKKHGLSDFIKVQGKPCWQVFIIKGSGGYSDLQIKTYLQQEILQAGCLWYGQHNMSFSHKPSDITWLLSQYDKAFARLARLIKTKKLKQNIHGGLITDIFKVR